MSNHPPDRWDDVPVTATPPAADEYVELLENGWGALIGWSAGPARLVRVPDELESHTTVVTCISPAGEEKYSRSRTAEEQAGVDDDINSYLRDCGAPVRPAGYRWFLRLPTGHDADQLWSAVNAGIPPWAVHPSDVGPSVREVVAKIYANAG